MTKQTQGAKWPVPVISFALMKMFMFTPFLGCFPKVAIDILEKIAKYYCRRHCNCRDKSQELMGEKKRQSRL